LIEKSNDEIETQKKSWDSVRKIFTPEHTPGEEPVMNDRTKKQVQKGKMLNLSICYSMRIMGGGRVFLAVEQNIGPLHAIVENRKLL